MIRAFFTPVEFIPAAGKIGDRSLFAGSNGRHISPTIRAFGNPGKQIGKASLFGACALLAPSRGHLKNFL